MVEGTGLENRQARKGLVGSNPTPSAIKIVHRTKFFNNMLVFLELGQAFQPCCADRICLASNFKNLSSAQ